MSRTYTHRDDPRATRDRKRAGGIRRRPTYTAAEVYAFADSPRFAITRDDIAARGLDYYTGGNQ